MCLLRKYEMYYFLRLLYYIILFFRILNLPIVWLEKRYNSLLNARQNKNRNIKMRQWLLSFGAYWEKKLEDDTVREIKNIPPEIRSLCSPKWKKTFDKIPYEPGPY